MALYKSKNPFSIFAFFIPTPTDIVSPGVVKAMFVCFIANFPTFIFQKFSLSAVSSGTLSVSVISTLALSSNASSRFTVSAPRSMPWAFKLSVPMFPLTLAWAIKSVVLSFISLNDSSSISTRLCNNGNSCISATTFLMSAIVSTSERLFSIGRVTLTPSTPKSKGKTRCTLSTEIFIPVSSEAYSATCLTAQF